MPKQTRRLLILLIKRVFLDFVIGDRVRVAEPGAAAGRPVALVAAREPRTRTMRRRLTAHSQPAIATHVDQLVVVSAVQPPPNRGLLDRFLVLAAAEGIDALLVLNKVDLGGQQHTQACRKHPARRPQDPSS